MTCRELRESISAFVDGEASPEEAKRVREHIAVCNRCRLLERRMRALGDGVRIEPPPVRDGFRDAVFARLDAEGVLPPRKRASILSWRWAAVPLAAAAALAFFLLAPRDATRGPAPGGTSTARLEAPAPGAPSPSTTAGPAPGASAVAPAGLPAPAGGNPPPLSAEDREMIALLDILEDPSAFDTGEDAEGMDLLSPGESNGAPASPGRKRSGA